MCSKFCFLVVLLVCPLLVSCQCGGKPQAALIGKLKQMKASGVTNPMFKSNSPMEWYQREAYNFVYGEGNYQHVNLDGSPFRGKEDPAPYKMNGMFIDPGMPGESSTPEQKRRVKSSSNTMQFPIVIPFEEKNKLLPLRSAGEIPNQPVYRKYKSVASGKATNIGYDMKTGKSYRVVRVGGGENKSPSEGSFGQVNRATYGVRRQRGYGRSNIGSNRGFNRGGYRVVNTRGQGRTNRRGYGMVNRRGYGGVSRGGYRGYQGTRFMGGYGGNPNRFIYENPYFQIQQKNQK